MNEKHEKLSACLFNFATDYFIQQKVEFHVSVESTWKDFILILQVFLQHMSKQLSRVESCECVGQIERNVCNK